MKDYYALLGIESNATKAEIKKNYRKLATKFHPDKSNASDAAEKFIIITEAYDVLSSRKKRAKYDLDIWEKLKRKQTTNQSFETVAAPRESSRTRRNKAQRKRSAGYHQATSQIEKLKSILVESLLLIFRYVPHVFGVMLAVVILRSAIDQLSDIFNSGLGRGIGICIFMAALVYAIFKIGLYVYEEFRKDIEAFSVFYKLPLSKVAGISISGLIIGLFIFIAILKML